MGELDARVAEIGRRLEWFRQEDRACTVFGASEHRYELAAPTSEDDLSGFEREHDVRLPEDYRAYLANLGNGGAGPFYGLSALAPLQLDQLPSHRVEISNADGTITGARVVHNSEPILLVLADELLNYGVTDFTRDQVTEAVGRTIDRVQGSYSVVALMEVDGEQTLLAFRDAHQAVWDGVALGDLLAVTPPCLTPTDWTAILADTMHRARQDERLDELVPGWSGFSKGFPRFKQPLQRAPCTGWDTWSPPWAPPSPAPPAPPAAP